MFSRRQKNKVSEFRHMHYWIPAKWQLVSRVYDKLWLLWGRPREAEQTVHLPQPHYKNEFNSALSLWSFFWMRDLSENLIKAMDLTPEKSTQSTQTQSWNPRALVTKFQATDYGLCDFHSFCMLFPGVLTIWSCAGVRKELANMPCKDKKIYNLGNGAKHKRWRCLL